MAADRAELLNDAVIGHNIKMVLQLLEEGTDVNSKVGVHGWTPLHSAVQNDDEEIVHLLLSKGADPFAKKANGATPFILAGITGNVKLLELFLDKGSDIDEHDINGFTAFMEAACYGQVEALKFLYKRGANVNLGRKVDEEKKAVNKGGGTALMDAASKGHLKVIQVLVEEMEADVNICDNQGRNALVHALSMSKKKDLEQNKEQAAFLLLKYGADVNKRDESGKTTLILAAERGSQGLVKAILEKGAPIVVAYNNEIKKILHQYGLLSNPSQETVQYTSFSRRWVSELDNLHKIYRPMVGKLKLFMFKDFIIQKNSHGGVYLGFYDGKEVAVKVFPISAESAEREKNCLEKCSTSSHLVKLLGWETDNTCLYLCLNLCERNLQEYFEMAQSADGTMESKDILTIIFQAVMELHTFGFGHQDLEPSNILIDAAGKIFLADFDKSRKIADDGEKDAIITTDLQALRSLVLYVVTRGKIDFGDLTTQCPKDVDNCFEIEDLIERLETPDKKIPMDQQLKKLICHPYFWNKNEKYNFLKDVGNESDIKTRNTKHHNANSVILPALNRDDDPFKKWTEQLTFYRTKKGKPPTLREDGCWHRLCSLFRSLGLPPDLGNKSAVKDIFQIDKEVLESMSDPFHEKKKKAKPKNPYGNCVTDLLKLIRNMDAHFGEKEEIHHIIKEPAEYFLKKFPDLTIYVHRSLDSINYNKYFPKAWNTPQQ